MSSWEEVSSFHKCPREGGQVVLRSLGLNFILIIYLLYEYCKNPIYSPTYVQEWGHWVRVYRPQKYAQLIGAVCVPWAVPLVSLWPGTGDSVARKLSIHHGGVFQSRQVRKLTVIIRIFVLLKSQCFSLNLHKARSPPLNCLYSHPLSWIK